MDNHLFNKEHCLFIKKFFEDSKGIATLFPSSKALATAACKYITTDKPQVIIEVGAGTGAMTRVALDKIHPESTYVAVEKDPDLASYIAKYPKQPTHLLICDVANLKAELQKLKINSIDVMISCLPTFNLPESTRAALFECYGDLTHPNSVFCQQTIVPWYYLERYKKIFNKVEFKLVLRNIPPGGIYYCWELKDSHHSERSKESP